MPWLASGPAGMKRCCYHKPASLIFVPKQPMSNAAIQRLQYLCQHIPARLRAIASADFEHSPAPGKWSKKEILGHLIDSATNNHQRFVRVQFEDRPHIRYDQNNWNTCSHYKTMDAHHLIEFWRLYNLHLAILIQQIPAAALSRECAVGDQVYPLSFIIDDYVVHMEHHLKQILGEAALS